MDATYTVLQSLADKLKAAGEVQKTTEYPHPTDDPLGFIRYLGVTPWVDTGFGGEDKLGKIVDSVFNGPNRFTVVESGNGVGKSYTAAAVVCAWIKKYDVSAVVTLAPTAAQVNNILWRNIRLMWQRADGVLPGEVLETPAWKISPDHYGIGLSPKRHTQEDVSSLFGYHNPNLLVVLDEAPGIPRSLWEAIHRLITADNNKILALGNPLAQAGPFWEACNSPAWTHIRVSCMNHPNVVTKETKIEGATGWNWVNERVLEHCFPAGEDDPGSFEWEGRWWIPNSLFQSMVLGQAPEEAEDQLIALNWVMGAMSWTADPGDAEPIVLGLDPSRVVHGDASCMVAKQGARVLWIKRRQPRTNDPSGEMAGWLKAEYIKIGAARAYVEETGIGSGVVDRARHLGVSVLPVSPASQATTNQWANKRAECWWLLREALQGGAVSLPEDDMLTADLTAPRFHYDALGRIQLEIKKKIKDRLGRSPDAGDALAITFAGGSGGGQMRQNTPTDQPISRWSVGVKRRGSRWRR